LKGLSLGSLDLASSPDPLNVDAIRAKSKEIQTKQQGQRMRSAAKALIPKEEDTGM
jgi:hypothetical protein